MPGCSRVTAGLSAGPAVGPHRRQVCVAARHGLSHMPWPIRQIDLWRISFDEHALSVVCGGHVGPGRGRQWVCRMLRRGQARPGPAAGPSRVRRRRSRCSGTFGRSEAGQGRSRGECRPGGGRRSSGSGFCRTSGCGGCCCREGAHREGATEGEGPDQASGEIPAGSRTALIFGSGKSIARGRLSTIGGFLRRTFKPRKIPAPLYAERGFSVFCSKS